MKILIIANSSMGLMKFRKELIGELQKEHDIYVVTKFDECIEELRKKVPQTIEVDMYRRGTNVRQERELFRQYWRVVKEIKPDIIITYTIKPNIYGGLVARCQKISYVANITGLGTAFQEENWFKRSIIRLYRIALKKAKVVFFENNGNKKVFLDNNIVNLDKCFVLNGAGVNLQEFSYKEYPVNEKVNFLFMGRVMKEKGIDELFEAIERLHEEDEKVTLTVLGEYEENYSEKVQELSARGIINYVGWVSDVKPYIEKCMCTVLPSYHEGMSNTLLECGAMGRPIIASDIPGCRETVNDGVSGYLVKVKDSKDLYEKMKKFYELSQEEKKEMGKAARKHVEKKFDKKEVVNSTIERMGLQ